ncbi:MAG: PepSY domain-containing protein [Caulobacterales bacterium]|jgi:uncharacterized membrane protein YkoI
MKRQRLIAALLLATAPLIAMAAPTPALAAQEGGREASQATGLVPLARVLRELAQHHPGKQLNTTMGQAGGRPAYLVQWQLADGRVVVFTVDAQTGQVVGQ